MGFLGGLFGGGQDGPDSPIVIKGPTGRETLMSYTKVIAELHSGDNSRMFKANMDINAEAKRYNDISLKFDGGQLIPTLLPLLKHDNYQVRVLVPSILGQIGDAGLIPILQEVIDNDSSDQLRKNARDAIEVLKGKTVTDFDSVQFVRRYEKQITNPLGGPTITGTYDEYRAPSRAVARAWLDTIPVMVDCYYIEVITPEGNLGKDKLNIY